MNDAHPDSISMYDRLVWPEGAVEKLLASGERRRELQAYFGEAEYQRLHLLAITAALTTPDPQRVVYVVPGILGSQLCAPRTPGQPNDLLWIDPADIACGKLARLAQPGESLTSCGPILHGYLPLKLALDAAGYTVRCFDYDWRRDIADTGAALAARIAAESARDISIVAHSMGGLLARYALQTKAGPRVQRVITLGTPHGGSFAPVQAVRGVYPLVRRLAQIDTAHSAEVLARDVFSSFHSLYQMLPLDSALDLIDARNWPHSGPQPNATLLDRVTMLRLGAADVRISAIAGYGFETTTQVMRGDEEFHYRLDFMGDGTVPTERATLAGCEAWFCNVAHNELTRNSLVHAAVLRLLSDEAPELPAAPPALHTDFTSTTDTQLRQQLTEKIDWSQLDGAGRRQFLDSLNSSPRAVR